MSYKTRLAIGNIILAPFLYWMYVRVRGIRLHEIFGWAAINIVIGIVIGAIYF